MSARAVLLDLDGTLTDPRPGIVRSIRHALDRLGHPCPDDGVLATCIGPPLRGSFGQLLETTDPSRIEQAMGFYRERFAEVGLYENEVYAGIPAMLEALVSAGGRLYVATAKPVVFAERIVRHFALDHHFARVYGPDLDGRLDDKADLLRHLLATERLDRRDAVMVGDRANDMAAAQANALRAIGVLWGYGSRAELLTAGAHAVCDLPEDLPTCLATLNAQRAR